MHVAQILLIEADSTEQALAKVSERLSSDHPRWSDWSNHGDWLATFAGRWEGEYFGKDNKNDVLCYDDDPTLAETVMFEHLSSRYSSIEYLKNKIRDDGFGLEDVATVDSDENGVASDEYHTYLWHVKKLSELLLGDWTGDSAVYDLEDWTADLQYFRKRLTVDPKKQFLVVVDFHY